MNDMKHEFEEWKKNVHKDFEETQQQKEQQHNNTINDLQKRLRDFEDKIVKSDVGM